MADDFKLNHKGMEAMLKSPGVRADLERRAERIATAAGDGMRAHSNIDRDRARAWVVTATPHAKRGEAKDRRLTRALDAGRG